MKYLVIYLFFIFLLSSSAFSEEKNFDFKRNESIFQTLGNDFISPFTEGHSNAVIIGSGALLLSALTLKKLNNHIQQDVSYDKPLGKYSKYGDFLGKLAPNIAYVAYNGTIGYLYSDNKSLYLAGAMARATFAAGLTANVLKYSVREKRPDPSTSKTGFPSGHSTTAFTFASVVAYQHGPWWGSASYLMASFVGYSRLNDNAHNVYDVVGGALIGIIYGISICQRDERFLVSSNNQNKTTFDFYPIISDKLAGAHFDISF